MLLVLLVLASPPATAVPAAAPTAVAVDPDRPRSLSDVAKERKGKPKPQGTFSVVGTGSAAAGAESSSPAVPGAEPEARVRIVESQHGSVDRGGKVAFSGSVQNNGEVPACSVRVTYRVVDENGKHLAARDVAVSSSKLMPGQVATFTGSLSMPPLVFNPENRVSSGSGQEVRYLGRGNAEIGSARACKP